MPRFLPVWAFGLGMTLASASQAADAVCKVKNPAHRVTLVELYTPQGCSS